MTESINLDAYVEPDIIIDTFDNGLSNIKIFYNDKEMHKKIQKAHNDVLNGRVKPVENVFAEIRQKYNL